MSDSLQPQGLKPARLLCPWNFPGKNTEVGCYSLLQGNFLTQGLNPGLLHCRQILYCLSRQGIRFLKSSNTFDANVYVCTGVYCTQCLENGQRLGQLQHRPLRVGPQSTASPRHHWALGGVGWLSLLCRSGWVPGSLGLVLGIGPPM